MGIDETMAVVLNFFFRVCLLAGLLTVWAATGAWAAESVKTDGIIVGIDRLVENGGLALARDGRVIFSRNLDQTFIPASILKIATALAASRILGPDYRFETRFYQDQAGNLIIQGLGDPFLVSEEVSLILDRLKERGVSVIKDIVLDDTAFDLAGPVDGAGHSTNPYDALNGALAVNFNTVNIIKDKEGRVRSAESQTPTLPIMAGMAADLGPGTHRLNISGRQHGSEASFQLVGQLFKALAAEKGMAGPGVIRTGLPPKGFAPVYVHRSSMTIAGMIGPLLLFSNNYIANQLFLACGAQRFGYPATWAKGRDAVAGFLKDSLKLSPGEFVIEEGSGLSRKNRITPQAMLAVLEAFRPYSFLLPEEKGRLLKSGTLTGVYSYAGYLEDSGNLHSLVIMLNQPANTRERILDLLERMWLSNKSVHQ